MGNKFGYIFSTEPQYVVADLYLWLYFYCGMDVDNRCQRQTTTFKSNLIIRSEKANMLKQVIFVLSKFKNKTPLIIKYENWLRNKGR